MNNADRFERSLQAVAYSSFYETVSIDGSSGTFDDDNIASFDVDEYATWTYNRGIEFHGPEPVDHSGPMEPGSMFDSADHIRYWIPGAVEALKRGHLVEFNYCIVRCGDCEYAADGGDCDYCDEGIVGWVLVAHITD